jgi:hypothetical protein
MIVIHVARVVAWLAAILDVLIIGAAFYIIFGIMTDISRAVAALKGSHPNAQTGKNEGRED